MALVQVPTLFGSQVDAHEYTETVELLGVKYELEFKFSERMGRWTLNVAAPDGTPMVTGAVVLLGVDLLAYCPPKLRPRGVLVAAWTDEETEAAEAGELDLGSRVKLYFYERPSDLEPATAPTEPERS